MSEMVERIKEAIARNFDPAIDFKAPYAKVMLQAAAEDVLAAMREPTSDMDFAGGVLICNTPEGASPDAIDVWWAMIDAALADVEKVA